MAELDEALIDQDAAWARRFQNSAQSLPQRARYRQAIAAGEAQQQRRESTARETLLQRDKGARDLYFGRERLADADARLNLDEARFQQAQEREAFGQRMQEDRFLLEVAKDRRLQVQNQIAAKNAVRIEEQTANALTEVDELMGVFAPKTEGFAAGIAAVMAKYPYLDKNVRSSLLGSAKIEDDEDTLDSVLSSLPEGSRPRITRSNKGFSVSVAPQEDAANPAEQLDSLRSLYDRAAEKRSSMETTDKKGNVVLKPGFSEDDRLFYDDEKRRIMGRIRELSPGTAGPASGAPAAAPATAQQSIFKDEAEAIASGAKRGDIVILINPATGKPAKARLE